MDSAIAICAYCDFEYLDAQIISSTDSNGDYTLLKVTPDKHVRPGYFYVLIDGIYHGCFKLDNDKSLV